MVSLFNRVAEADTDTAYCETADKYMWWAGNSNQGETREVGMKSPNP